MTIQVFRDMSRVYW